jgi:hypothetical protein
MRERVNTMAQSKKAVVDAPVMYARGTRTTKPGTFFAACQEVADALGPVTEAGLIAALEAQQAEGRRLVPLAAESGRKWEGNPEGVIKIRARYACKHGYLVPVDSAMSVRETAALLTQEAGEAERAGAFDPLNLKDDRQRAIASIVRRRGQPEFRQKLLTAYGHRCAVSGCDAVEALEAAHIIPYQGVDTNHLSNGLILRGDLHTLFDLGLMAVDADSLTVVLSPALLHTSYGEFHGRQLSVPESAAAQPSDEALRQHRAGCSL